MPEFRPLIELSKLDPDDSFKIVLPPSADYEIRGISLAGDVNGDGFTDLILGSFDAEPNGYRSGSVFIVYGSSSGFPAAIRPDQLDGGNGFRIDGSAAYDAVGFAVGSAGDVNGDGIDDFFFGAGAGDPDGVTYIVFGNASGFPANLDLDDIDSSMGFRISGVPRGSIGDIAPAGDVNGDGFDDIIIGSQFAMTLGNMRSGAAYVVFGKASGLPDDLPLSELDGSNGFRISGKDAYDYLGVRVTGVGDVNGDGFDDVAITDAPYGGGTTSYVVFGKDGGFRSNFNLDNLNGRNGFAFINAGTKYDSDFIAAAGDVNGDGFDDIIVGNDASFGNAGIGYTGSAAVIFGKAGGFASAIRADDFTGKDGFQMTGEGHYSYIGSTVSTAGDVNGDGFDDVLVVAGPLDPDEGGFTFVVFGKASGFDPLIQLQDIDGSNGFKITDSEFDWASVTPGGDFNHDGFDDLLATRADGSAFIIYGHRALTGVTRIGTSIDNTINGGRGQDVIRGLGGYDWLIGWEDADRIFGGAGEDRLAGRAGNDILNGGAGSDLIIGGLGGDIFDYNSASDSTAGANRDVIRDFRFLSDRIDVSDLGPLEFIGTDQFDGAGQIRVRQSGVDTVIAINLTGDTNAEMQILLANVEAANISVHDFIF